jgi:type III restriction enzyme
MKIQFNGDLPYQRQAINAVLGVFSGLETCSNRFSVAAPRHKDDRHKGTTVEDDIGIGNRLPNGFDDELLDNVRAVQLVNGLPQADKLLSRDFTIEMETGTGKTYVYLRSIFEMHQRYGFSKFIIVVPSVAIRAGVIKTLQMTEQHFKQELPEFAGLYYDYFLYDSAKREQVRSFATNDYLQIMVINIDAFRKGFDNPDAESKATLIHRPDDRLNGMKPIEFIRATQPILIIDEPQSVDNTPKSKEAIKSLNPLCSFRFSATHKDKYHPLYKLDAIDAYQNQLVKQIEVASLAVLDSHNQAYIKLLKVDIKNHSAQLELDVMKGGKISREKKKVKSGTDLLEVTKRDIYDGYVVNDVYCEVGNEYIDFTSKPEVLRLGESIGEGDADSARRLQVRMTIEAHLEKELVLNPQGIKVLSLFFIDKVANYREYDTDGNPLKGKYAQWFEEEYTRLVSKPKFKSLFGEIDFSSLAAQVHDGYFARDKKKIGGKSVEVLKDSSGEGKTAADDSAYDLIMSKKEALLSFDTPLRFIFSHSALREGWDNPNVFQICTLNETASVMKKRQEIGRGLRLAVNQQGERIHGFEVNTLTVMANESYLDFVAKLQKEIEEDEGIKFGVVEDHLFANLITETADGQHAYLGADASVAVWNHLKEKGYIDAKGKVQDALKLALKSDAVDLPYNVQAQAPQIIALLKKVAGGLDIKDASKGQPVKLNKQVFLGEDFKALWDKIKHQTVYRVRFDSAKLVQKCAEEIKKNLVVGKSKYIKTIATVDIDKGGVAISDVEDQQYTNDLRDFDLPDVVGFLQEETNLTRRSVAKILLDSGRLESFKINPQKFIEGVSAIIKQQMRLFIVVGIKYRKIGDQHYYAQEMFQDVELRGYLGSNMLASQKSVYDHVVYDSNVEEKFATAFEASKDIRVYAKLPSWFKIDTPLGSYNPDWAVLVEQDGEEKLFFVVETKGSLLSGDLRPIEQGKIDCGEKHFAALGSQAQFAKADSFESFVSQWP